MLMGEWDTLQVIGIKSRHVRRCMDVNGAIVSMRRQIAREERIMRNELLTPCRSPSMLKSVVPFQKLISLRMFWIIDPMLDNVNGLTKMLQLIQMTLGNLNTRGFSLLFHVIPCSLGNTGQLIWKFSFFNVLQMDAKQLSLLRSFVMFIQSSQRLIRFWIVVEFTLCAVVQVINCVPEMGATLRESQH
jgi:hypothetical protein